MCGNVLDGIRTGGQVGSWGRTPEFFREPSSFGRPQGQGPPWDPRQMFLQGGGIPLPVRDSMPLPVREKNGGHHVVMLNGADMKGYGDASHNQIMVGAARNESDEHLKALSIRSRHQTRQTVSLIVFLPITITYKNHVDFIEFHVHETPILIISNELWLE
ncbi:unnamed protein product [Triticum turgidum subsp. durum]|uniref:Uncharacterized protein n=1 Tax=Triticum turgidum subsp. durum TaxID=4567 RepID=A0A9R0X311_TRITD|nr:unnamed protein product [Triticum turgidum subsp. durum]